MKRIVKTITYYDDGTYEEKYADSIVPTFPPYTDPRKCSKCGISLNVTMGYCCPNTDCPTGLGTLTC